eukprot:scpid76706/ scgid9762/ Zinc finger BED domain-containing protein 1; Putative Ac-like transposable element; dREF homolog
MLPPGKAKVSLTKRSPAWAYFEEADSVARCNSCSREFVRQSGTTNLFQHLISAHKDQYAAAVGKGPATQSTATTTACTSNVERSGSAMTSAGTKPVTSFFGTDNLRTCDSRRSGMLTESIIDWIVDSSRPFSIVEDRGLIDLLKLTEPEFKVPSRTHFASLINKRHMLCIQELKTMLSTDADAGVCLTTDGWSSTSTQSFITHTVHFVFVDKDWKIVSGVLETGVFSGTHTGERLAMYSMDVAKRFGLQPSQVVAVTHDEAANMVTAGRLMAERSGWLSCVCMAHRLQTVVRHALALKEVAKLLCRSRKVVGHFKHSCLAAEALASKQQQLNASQTPLKVVQDVSTRWNSTYYMLSRLLKLRVALTAVLCDPDITPKRDDRNMLLKDREWDLAEQLMDLLGPFEMATTAVSGQKYATLSILMPICTHLYSEVQANPEKSISTAAQKVADKLCSEMERKFPDVVQANPTSIPVVASALDPRFRGLVFLDKEKSAAVWDVVKDMAEERAINSGTVESIEPEAKRLKTSATSGLSRLLQSRHKEDAPVDLSAKLHREIDLFSEEPQIDLEADPLEWWRSNAYRFPNLAQLARRYLGVPGSSVPSERVFSAAGLLVTELRNGLSPAHIDASIFLACNATLPSARFHLQPQSSQPPVVNIDDEDDDGDEYYLPLPEVVEDDSESGSSDERMSDVDA